MLHGWGRVFVIRLGLSELTCDSLTKYEELAVELAQNPSRLQAIRTALSNVKDQPLFDVPNFTRSLEQAFDEMWRIHVSGDESRSFHVTDL